MVYEICYFSLPFFWAQNFIFHLLFLASKMFDDIYYFLSHFNQVKFQNFGLLKCGISYFRSTFRPAKILKLPVCVNLVITVVPEILVACNFSFFYSKFHVSESGRFHQPYMVSAHFLYLGKVKFIEEGTLPPAYTFPSYTTYTVEIIFYR
jgi:hypothetical protein